ncbi:MAG: helicase-related protein [Candidatus Pedobacter colombiensis]|uniref:Helicase-related protein n=1 Tax=Candidatus Pedobacter colombiensis TaxID=3121371 RepID=A0AAJ5W4H3_9SPHI|nr:helicase-related protein [Pedobacter sp.]WEK17904.1 MAG: helicase-related protein [Pedobacter sp.]
MAYNTLHKLRDNIAAIRIALVFKQGDVLSDTALAELRLYSGFGGIKAVLLGNGSKEEWTAQGAIAADFRLYDDVISLHQLLKEHFDDIQYGQVIASMKNSALTSFYTPEVIPQTLYQSLAENGIYPKRIYEPSAGAGIFITEAYKAFPTLELVTAVEKDLLTGKVLQAIAAGEKKLTSVQVCGFEESTNDDHGQYDLIVSNIPFGNFTVYDPAFPQKELSGKIHNYFFAKGLEKLADGGMLAYITTSAFLNNASNKEAVKYLLERADFVSLHVLPDNLMKDTGNTEAPCHLLVLQKNSSKAEIKSYENFLLETTAKRNEYGSYTVSSMIALREHDFIIGNVIKAGTNQYGQATEVIWQEGGMDQIAVPLSRALSLRLQHDFNKEAFAQISFDPIPTKTTKEQKLTLLPLPETRPIDVTVQLGLFDVAPAESINRAHSYLTDRDTALIQKQTVRIISTIKTKEAPGHESILLLTAKLTKGNRFAYKLISNLQEIEAPAFWMDAYQLSQHQKALGEKLKEYDHAYFFEGDLSLESAFGLKVDGLSPYSEMKPFYRLDTLVTQDGMVGLITYEDRAKQHPLFDPLVSQNDLDFYKGYTQVRDLYLELFHAEASDPLQLSNATLRNELNEQYDTLTAAYGQFNSPKNKKLIMADVAFGLNVLSSLERRDLEQYVKSDIFSLNLNLAEEAFKTDKAIEALAHCLNMKGFVDINFIAGIIEKNQQQCIAELGEHIYLNPITDKWETADAFLSGNVVDKLARSLSKVQDEANNTQYQRSIDALEKIQPEKIPFELLDFNLGERWIPVSYYEKFGKQLFDLETTVSFLSSLDTFKVTIKGSNAKVDQEYAIRPKSGKNTYGYTLLEHALENTSPFFTYETQIGGQTVRIPDNDATQLAHQKIENIRGAFLIWLTELPSAERKALELLYNDTFNCYRLREYDGSHLSFPGLNKAALGIEDLYSSQKNAAWRIIENRGGLIDHEVGLGKTLTMIIAAQEMKRLDIVRKPMILALKSNASEIRDTYKLAYPKARILAPDDSDYEPAKRLRLFHEIKSNNWDCVILTHDQFIKIPQAPEVQQAILQAELDCVDQDLETLRSLGDDISKSMLKGLEIRKNNLTGKLKGIEARIEKSKDEGIDFREMGIDHLFIDESHKFKNLTFTTRHGRVSGLGNTEGSQKSLNMLFAIRTLQQKFDADLCATFLSGTPISNSLTELYLIFKYLRPKEMKRQGIENFDGWAAVYARKTTDFEFSVTNEIIAKERFRHFIKVPELAMFYNEITDYKTAQHIHLDKPELDEELVSIKPTGDQQEYIKCLMAFAKTGNAHFIGRPALSASEDKARMLIATNYAKKMSADMRLIDPVLYEDHPNHKVNVCARKVAEWYEKSHEQKGTQIIFSDIGTPKAGVFNLYDALKEKLVKDFNIPAHEITFIHDNDWVGVKRAKLFNKMNSGQIRILLGSTEKAGTGLNVQQRMVAMHHIDIPWKPSELEQRNGRGARKGNWVAKAHFNNKIKSYIYAVEQSLDNYKFNLLKNKQLFISQMKNNELHIRTIDEGSIDEKSGMNFSEYIAILSGDTSLLEKSKVEKKLAVLENLKKAHFREISNGRFSLEKMILSCERKEAILGKLREDNSHYQRVLKHEKDGIKSNPLQLSGCKHADTEVLGKYLIDLHQTAYQSTDNRHIGSLYGYELFLVPKSETNRDNIAIACNSFFARRSEDGIHYTYNGGYPNTDNPKLAARYFLSAIDMVGQLEQRHQKELIELKKEIPLMEKILEKPFQQEEDLLKLKSTLSLLEKEINSKIQERQLAERQPKDSVEQDQVDGVVTKVENLLLVSHIDAHQQTHSNIRPLYQNKETEERAMNPVRSRKLRM